MPGPIHGFFVAGVVADIQAQLAELAQTNQGLSEKLKSIKNMASTNLFLVEAEQSVRRLTGINRVYDSENSSRARMHASTVAVHCSLEW